MSQAACEKKILNDANQGAMTTFHFFADLGLADENDYKEVSKAEEKLLEVVNKVNKRIAERQP